MLSSCQSGDGVVVDSQGVLGLRAAFLNAGATAVVMSLWPVGDEASRQFMNLFYAQGPAAAAAPAAALRAAQRAMRALPQYSDPFFWAGYVVAAKRVSRPPPTTTKAVPQTQASPQAAATANAPLLLATPVCLEGTSRPDASSKESIRLSWGGAVQAQKVAPGRAVYTLLPPLADFELGWGHVAPNGAESMAPDRQQASLFDCHSLTSLTCRAITATIERTATTSSLLIRVGDPIRYQILLKGGPEAFKTLDLPQALPPLSGLTEALFWEGNSPKKQRRLATLNPCRAADGLN